MRIYLVGGAVRDQQLGLPIAEKDWVVVGATPAKMIELGFQPVGKDFPVFLHPDTKEEYALARTERKSGHGYAGFVFNTDVSVSLTQDLLRRDITINAIAQDDSGELIDPYHGLADIKQRKLRHVSSAFIEDPVRILRVARFAARFAHLNFSVADETMTLMQQMVGSGEVDYLVAERVWQEFTKALRTQTPSEFFKVLQNCAALKRILPELKHAGYVDAINLANSDAPDIRFAILTAHLSQATKPIVVIRDTLQQLQLLIKRLKIPKSYAQLAKLTARWHYLLPRVERMSAGAIVDFIQRCDGLRRPERFDDFLLASQIIWRVKQHNITNSCKLLQDALNAIRHVDTESLQQQGLRGSSFGIVLRKKRINEVSRIR